MARKLKRLHVNDTTTSVANAIPEVGKILKGYPTLWEFLTLTEWEEDVPRERGTLLFFVEDGLMKGCLNDKDSGYIAFLSGGSLEDLLEGLEAGLAEESLEWRMSRAAKGATKKKKG